MPWCDACARYLAPNALTASGECPACGRPVAEASEVEPVKAPWHFKLLVFLAVVYLVWRFAQLAGVLT